MLDFLRKHKIPIPDNWQAIEKGVVLRDVQEEPLPSSDDETDDS